MSSVPKPLTTICGLIRDWDAKLNKRHTSVIFYVTEALKQ